MQKKIWFFVFGMLISLATNLSAGNYSYATNSLLSTGKWVKIKIGSTGIQKLSYDKLIQMGFSDPSKVRVYGFGGAMLSEAFNVPKFDNVTTGDLPEVAVIKGNNYILFWGQGTISWKYLGNNFIHTVNPYSTAAYYFLTDSQGIPTPMAIEPSAKNPTDTIRKFNDYALHELDLYNIGKTGREFYGEDFSYKNSQTFPFTIKGLIDTINYTTNFISKSTVDVTFSVSINGALCTNVLFPKYKSSDNIQYENAKELTSKGIYVNTDNNIDTFKIKIEYGKTGDLNCRLNYIRLNMMRSLKLYDSATPFRSIQANGKNVCYELQNANPNVIILDITDGGCKQIQSQLIDNKLTFNAISDTYKTREFVAVDSSATFAQPEFVCNVANQNLHALPQTDMVIISPSEFYTTAEKLANLHRDPNGDNLKVTIVTPESIYNEFSSGTPDATAYRWFMKMFYDRATSSDNKPKYLLLMGDGTYDNRLLGEEWLTNAPANKILTYESVGSLVETASYVCDDYFGFLDDYEGVNITSESLDIGIGRLPVKTPLEAENVVNKIINYSKNNLSGSWKNNLCYVADDGDGNLHMNQANNLCSYIESNYKSFITNKIFLDSFKKEFTSTGATYPSARNRLFEQINSGLLSLVYTGHGSTNSWTTEQILTISDIRKLTNTKLPIWITATCDFSRFDQLNTSAGEEVLLNPIGGGIALITTTRIAFSEQNYLLNWGVHQLLFKKNSDGTRLRLGDVIRQTKNSLNPYNQNKLNFTLLGDPALTLRYPESKMEITTMNGIPYDQSQTISALSDVILKGHVLKNDGTIDDQFKGSITHTVFDAQEDITTLNNDNIGSFKYKDRNKILFTGKDSILNGVFTFKFKVPKDMSYSNKNGKINLYGRDVNGNEAQGYFENFTLYGTNPDAILETNGPQINKIYLNSEDFVNGYIVNEKPTLFVDLQDQSGINVSGTGIGHDMTLTIDGNRQTTYNLNSYFEAKNESSNAGRVTFNIPELAEGKHTLFFKVWDIQNNSTNTTLECVVKKAVTPETYEVFTNSPILLSNAEAHFHLKQDSPNTQITMKLEIYDLSGTEIWSYTVKDLSDIISSTPIKWNLKNKNGDAIAPGAYHYKTTIYSELKLESSKTKKIIILNQ